MPSIRGPSSAARTGPPPSFAVDSAPGHFYAYELATDPLLFAAGEHSGQRTAANFYASWEHQSLASASTFQLAASAWRQLANAERLYYRVLTSTRSDRWADVQTSSPDNVSEGVPFSQIVGRALGGVMNEAQAPVERIWAAATSHAAFRSIMADPEARGLIAWHMFSPRRPIDPRAAEWVVVAASAAWQRNAVVHTGLARLEVQSLSIKEARAARHTSTPVQPHELTATIDTGAWRISPDQVRQEAGFLIISNLRPPPGALGGTVIAHLASGAVLYHATTTWDGQGRVLVG
jgi:hypothetical protein